MRDATSVRIAPKSAERCTCPPWQPYEYQKSMSKCNKSIQECAQVKREYLLGYPSVTVIYRAS